MSKKSGRGANLSFVRPKGSPKATTPQVGKKWKILYEETRPTDNSSRTERNDEIVALHDKNNRLKAELKAATMQAALRDKKAAEQPATPHRLPNSPNEGRPLTLETLRYVASICASGSQPSKVQKPLVIIHAFLLGRFNCREC